jgi:hypothetical protein
MDSNTTTAYRVGNGPSLGRNDFDRLEVSIIRLDAVLT